MLLHFYMRRQKNNRWLLTIINEKEANEMKELYNHYLDNRSDIMKDTQLKVGDVSGNFIGKDNISQDQINKLNNVSAKIMYIFVFVY